MDWMETKQLGVNVEIMNTGRRLSHKGLTLRLLRQPLTGVIVKNKINKFEVVKKFFIIRLIKY
jgi:hypothetical protein